MKPPKNLTPPDEDGKNSSRGFDGDSFRSYMSRKIDLQRKQNGLILPPPPPSPEKEDTTGRVDKKQISRRRKAERVRFADDVEVEVRERKKRKKKKKKQNDSDGMLTILKRLQQKHGKDKKDKDYNSSRSRKRRRRKLDENPKGEGGEGEEETPSHVLTEAKECVGDSNRIDHDDENSEGGGGAEEEETPSHVLTEAKECVGGDSNRTDHDEEEEEEGESNFDARGIYSDSTDKSENSKTGDGVVGSPSWKRLRPDLFFFGIVVLVNGYTNPDVTAIQRMLHQHGGDLEKYETSRVTHIIAEHLSTAKANIYKKQRKPIPVCHPNWIVDGVKSHRLLPYADYLIEEVRDVNIGSKSVKSFFALEDVGSKPTVPKKAETKTATKTANVDSDHINTTASTIRRNEENFGEIPESAVVDRREGGDCKDRGEPEKESTGTDVKHQDSQGNFPGGKLRTTGTDPNFLESFFSESRLSFIGSFKQRAKSSPIKKGSKSRSLCHRFVFHVDMDSFFASVVLRNYPEYQDKPVAISHMGKDNVKSGSKQSSSECATCNYVARKYGVKKGMYLGRARELCSELVVLPYDFTGYEEVSEQVSDILFRHAQPHDGAVEQVSCDEAYLELFLSINDDDDISPYDFAAEIASNIRREIFATTRCTASIGVASNKLLAKLGTDKVKPNNSYVVRDYRKLLEPLKLKELHGIGYRTDQKLQTKGLVTVNDVWDLGDEAKGELISILGPGLGKKIFLFCQGEDTREVKPAERKTIGAECNYGVRFDGPYGVDYMIKGLAKEVQKRMESVGVLGRRITLKLKKRKKGAKPPPKFLGHGSCHNLSKSSDTAATRDWKVIARIGMELFNELKVPKEDVRGMGIIISKLPHESQHENERGTLSAFFGGQSGKSEPNRPVSKQPEKEVDTTNSEGNFVDIVENLKETDNPSTPNSVHQDKGLSADSTKIPSLSQIDMKTLSALPFDIRKEIVREANSKSQEPETKDDEKENPQQIDELSIKLSDETTTEKQDDEDVALPPLSQIHMSQVMFLPSPLRKQVVSKIQCSPKDNSYPTQRKSSSSPDMPCYKSPSPKIIRGSPNNKKQVPGKMLADDERTNFRQASVKRMLKLAAVKTGEETLSESLGGSISLTQLECLPFEMQLQIANNDDVRVRRSPIKRPVRAQVSKPTSPIAVGPTSKVFVEDLSTDEAGMKPVEEVADSKTEVAGAPQDCRSFYQKNILPLLSWMDDRPIPDDDDSCRVKDFLCLCVTEQRCDDAIKMLRAIRNRNDFWRKAVYPGLLEAIDDAARIELGSSLDREWLGL